MPLTQPFIDTVRERAAREPGFRRALLREAIECLLAGEIRTGTIVLRNYINATVGFEPLSTLTGIPSKSLMRMFGPNGNPQARNLFQVIGHLQRAEGVHVHVSIRRKGRAAGPRKVVAKRQARIA
jgi:hypothetical protein